MGSSPRVRRTLGPTAEFLRVLPVIAIVPIAIVLLGVGDAMRIGVIAFGVFFPVLVATVEGVRSVSPELRDTAALLGLSRVGQSVRVYLPAALPTIFAGLRTALSIGLVLIVISELKARGTAWASTSSPREPSSTSPRCTSASPSSACSGTC